MYCCRQNNKTSGFTLLELLIAIAVFSVLAVMAYGGLGQVIDNSNKSNAELNRLTHIQKAMFAIGRDLSQFSNRPIRNSFDDRLPALLLNDFYKQFEFTRSGRKNPAGLKRSSLIRVSYRVEDNNFYRVFWTHIDRAENTEPYESLLLENVESYSVRILDAEDKWHKQWPPIDPTTGLAINQNAGQNTGQKLWPKRRTKQAEQPAHN